MSASIDRVANHDGEFKFDLDFTEGYKVNSLTARTAFEYAQALLEALGAKQWKQAEQKTEDFCNLLNEIVPSHLGKPEVTELRKYLSASLCAGVGYTYSDFTGWTSDEVAAGLHNDDLKYLGQHDQYMRVLYKLHDIEMFATMQMDWDFRYNGTGLDQFLQAIPSYAPMTVSPFLSLPLDDTPAILAEGDWGRIETGMHIDAYGRSEAEGYLSHVNLSSVSTLTTIQLLENGNWMMRNAWFTHDDPETDALIKDATDSDSSANEEEEATGIRGRLNQLVDVEISSDRKIVAIRSSYNGYDAKTDEFVANYFRHWYVNQELGVEGYVPPVDWRAERLRSEEA